MSGPVKVYVEDAGKESIERAIALLGDSTDAVKTVAARAVNRAITASRQEAVRLTREAYTVRAGTVRESLTLKKASAKNPEGSITSKGKPIPLVEFSHNPTSPGVRRQVRVAVKKENRKAIRGAFIASASGSSRKGYQIFIRKGRERGPIKMLFGPSAPQMIGNENVLKKMEERAAEIFNRRFDHEVGRELDRMAKK